MDTVSSQASNVYILETNGTNLILRCEGQTETLHEQTNDFFLNVTTDILLVNLFDFEPIINELELVDDVERRQFSFKDLGSPLQRPGFSDIRNFWHFSWIVPILAIFGVADWLWRRLRLAPDPAIAK